MNDDRKKPTRSGAGRSYDKPRGDSRPREDGDRKPFRKREGGEGRPFRVREDGERKPFRPREDGDRKPFRKREDGEGRSFRAREDGERKPFRPREDGDRKPFRKREDGEGRPFRAREDGERKPFRPREDGDRKPFRKREDGEGRPFRAREDGERKPFRPREDGDRKPFRKREDGEGRPFRAREDGERKPFRPREDGDRKPFRKREDGESRPFRAREDGERKPFRPREEGDRPRFPRPGRRERENDANPSVATEDERIARRLARAGIASRRDAEEMIAAGRVAVNGKVLESPAINVGSKDSITVDGQPIPDIERTRLFLFHKPSGVVTTNRDPQERQTVFDILPSNLPRLMTIGRLDINTEGLLLMTNDGGLSRVLELPATGWLRRYRVRVHGKVEAEALESLKDGVAVDGVFYGGVEATLDREQGSNAWLTVGLREGKNREVKNILGSIGLDVTRLIRISYGPFQLGDLKEGEIKEIKGRLLREQLGERLIAESGANFDAPVLNEFSNKPVPARTNRRDEDSESAGLINRKRERENRREDGLARLQTKKPAFGEGRKPFRDNDKGGARGFGKSGGHEERKEEPVRSRTTNVWMAPGAKPMGEKKAAALAERNEGRRYAGKPRPASSKPGDKFGDRKPGHGAGRPSGGPRKPRGDR